MPKTNPPRSRKVVPVRKTAAQKILDRARDRFELAQATGVMIDRQWIFHVIDPDTAWLLCKEAILEATKHQRRFPNARFE